MSTLVVLILSSLIVHRLAVVLQHTAAFYPPRPSVMIVMRDRFCTLHVPVTSPATSDFPKGIWGGVP